MLPSYHIKRNVVHRIYLKHGNNLFLIVENVFSKKIWFAGF